MRLGAFTVADAFPEPEALGRDRHREIVELAGQCERCGLSSFWVAEHHFHDGGLCPSPPVLLAAIGERTERIRLGVMVSVLTFHEPTDVAEQYALLDRLVGGRLEFGVGSGYLPVEFEGFGLDPAERRERFDEALSTVLAAWRGEEVRVRGARGTPVRLNVRPVQRPTPPVTIAAQRRESIVGIGGRGDPVALIPYATVADLGELAETIRAYRAALPEGRAGRVTAAVHVYAGRDPEGARRALQRYLDARRASGSRHFLEKVAKDPEAANVPSLEAHGLAAIGSPSEAAAALAAFARAGVDEVLGIFDFGGLARAEVLGSVAAVAPAARHAGLEVALPSDERARAPSETRTLKGWNPR